ncbi:hypothetical protein YDYSG_27170 [Paenibacillus tyrfis]|nr:hypothetical protein YDYSG_27170 [Paenibacillus tyrfis]
MNVLQKTGSRIKAIRKFNGLSQEALAEKADLHYVYIGGMERGERNINPAKPRKDSTGFRC